MVGEFLAEVILDAIMLDDVGPDHLFKLVPLVGAMQAGGDQDQDLIAWNALVFQDLEHGRQQHAIGNGPGDVADQDTGALAPPGKLGERRRARRPRQDGRDGLLGI